MRDIDAEKSMIEPKDQSPIPESQGTSDLRPQGHGVEPLNSQCFCISVDSDGLKRELETKTGTHHLPPMILENYPNMFASMPVFVSRHNLERMAAIIAAVESVFALPMYREIILKDAPAIAQFDGSGAKGVFLSYDFHLAGPEPKLIEINTNAGGALLNAALARAQKACCIAIADMTTNPVEVEALEQTFINDGDAP